MQSETLEFLISQHFDGTLDAASEVSLHEAIAADAAARQLFDDHAKLDATLRGTRSTLSIDPDWLAGQIGDHIDEANATPIRIRNWGTLAPIAMAACLLIGLTLGVIFLKEGDETVATTINTPNTSTVVHAAVTEIALVGTPTPPTANSGYAAVTVGVPANLTPQIVASLYLAQDNSASHVSIRAAGRRSGDAFD